MFKSRDVIFLENSFENVLHMNKMNPEELLTAIKSVGMELNALRTLMIYIMIMFAIIMLKILKKSMKYYKDDLKGTE